MNIPLIKSDGGNRPCDVRQPAICKVLIPAVSKPKDEVLTPSVLPSAFFIDLIRERKGGFPPECVMEVCSTGKKVFYI